MYKKWWFRLICIALILAIGSYAVYNAFFEVRVTASNQFISISVGTNIQLTPVVGEIVGQDKRSKTTYLGNNQYQYEGSIGTIYYQDEVNQWQTIDANYEEVDTDGFSVKFTKLPYLIRMGEDSGRRIYPDRNDLSYWIEFQKPYPSMGLPTRQDGWFYWNFTDAIMGVKVGNTMVKFGFRLKNSNAPTSITIPFTSQGITRSGRFLYHSDKVVAELRKPTAIDANGVERDCQVSFASGSVTISLNTIGLVFPIDIDPTMTMELESAPFPQVESINGGNNNSNATSHTVNLPSGIVLNDVVLVFFASDGSPTITFPAGWIELFQNANGTNNKLGAWYRVANGTEGATITVTTSASERTAHTSYRISGAGGTPCYAPTTVTGASVSPNPPSGTPFWAQANTLWFAACGYDYNRTVSAYPTNYTNGRNDYANNTQGCGVGTARREVNAASEDPGTFTISASDDWVANTVAIQPKGTIYTIGASSDDGYEKESDNTLNTTTAILYAYSNTSSASRFWVGVRFTGVLPTMGSTAVAGYATINIGSATYDDANLSIYCQDAAGGVTFDASNKIIARTRTTNSAPWVADGIGSGAKNSPALDSALQEIVTDYTLTSIVLIWKPNIDATKTLQFYSYNYGGATIPTLTMTWTEPATVAIAVDIPTYDFGAVNPSATPYTTTSYFTIDNTSGVQTDQTISVTATTWAGGVTWTHSDTATAGANTAGLLANKGGTWGTGDVIIKYDTPNFIAENQAANTDYSFGLKLIAPTSFTDGVQKTITVRITAAAG